MSSSKRSWFDRFFRKTVPKKEKNSNQEQTLHEMMIWLRKTEQSTESIGARLAAVEQRLSLKTRLSHPQWYTQDEKNAKQLQKNTTFSSEVTNNHQIDKNDLFEELATMQSLLVEQQHKISSLVNKSLTKTTNEHTIQQHINQLNENLNTIQISVDAIQKRQAKQSFSMKVKGREIPIEISGIIGGVLAFIVAVLIGVGGKDIVVSPVFLSVIGVILIASSLFRSVNVTEVLKQLVTKSSQADSKNDY